MICLKNNTLKWMLWCGREDSNFHGCYPTATSTLRVYQFRHDRTVCDLVRGRIEQGLRDVKRENANFLSFLSEMKNALMQDIRAFANLLIISRL